MTIVKYLFKRFFPVFIGSVIFSSIVLNLVDLLMNLWKYIQNQVPADQVFKIMLLYTPKTIWYAVPMGILFASSYTLSSLYASNELTAIFASGVSLLRFTLPLLLFSFLLSFGLFFLDDRLAVETYAKKTEMQNKVLNQQQSLDNNSLVILAELGNLIYKANVYDNAQKRLYDVYFIFRDDNKKLQAIIHADSASWDDSEEIWHIQNGIQFSNINGKIITEDVSSELTNRLVEPSDTFKNNIVSVEEVSAKEAKQYIKHLMKTGLPYGEALSLYYKKFAFPFVVFIVVFLSIGLSGRSTKNVVLISLALSIGSAVLFYVTQMITMLLAKFGYISPFSGAWFPVILFTILSIVLLRFTRT